MWTEYLLFLLGTLLVYVGAEATTKGGGDAARNFEMNPMLIGVTIIAFGTSAPELFVSVNAALGEGEVIDISLGNIMGSNITNVGLALGLPLMITVLPIDRRRDLPDTAAMVAITLLFFAMPLIGGLHGTISWMEGLIFLLVFAGFLAWSIRRAITGPYSSSLAEELQEEAKSDSLLSVPSALGLLVLGLAGLVWGADLMVDSSVLVAEQFGIRKNVIGVTMVAFGTSVPEVAICCVGAIREETGVSLGNIVGSNIFNLLLVGGCASLFATGPLQMEDNWMYALFVVVFSILLLGMVIRNRDAGWKSGLFLILLYTGFLYYVAHWELGF